MIKNTLITAFPRIGENRELKKALESYWSKKLSLEELIKTAASLRKKHLQEQQKREIEFISSNDFSYYDQMLDTAVMLNAIPERFLSIENPIDRYFAMARGTNDIPAMAMVKWFNTNYHYIVPELNSKIKFNLNPEKIINEYKEAKEIGIKTKINLIGPLTFVGLSKITDNKDTLYYINQIIPIYGDLLKKLLEIDDSLTIQFEEPIFVKNPVPSLLSNIRKTYQYLSSISSKINIIVTTYFEHSTEATRELVESNVWGIGLDFVYGPKNFESLNLIKDKKLIAGIIDGRNIWTSDYEKILSSLRRIEKVIPKEDIIISTSCSLLHVPYTVKNEPDSELKKWFSFALEKVEEVAFMGRVFNTNELSPQYKEELEKNKKIIELKKSSNLINNIEVIQKLKNISPKEREGSFEERNKIQKEKFKLPLLPTTTIGSFPQTSEIRKLRSDFKNGIISAQEYEDGIKKYIDECIAFQEEAGLDVFVHGEPERNDMVEYFGENLRGFHITKNGWVQSYGSRCVKPPIIFGDISRPQPITVKWITYAQSKTNKIVKGMLTGPVTIVNWSFVRDDVPRSTVAKQIAIALRDEISDLQEAGIKIIQVDEAAFKEGYPLRKENIKEYEEWAVESFKVTISLAKKETQIHTHMCYSEFEDIIHTIEAMDADVITIETARSGNKLLKIFESTGYKNEIGPGVYDIHSPRIPSINEFKEQILLRLQVLDKSKMWVNPDCGLKTRKWEEVKLALKNMVAATEDIRKSL
ncbi:MAG: 5-methyltetrahydropteroyltriglutamate--homocysteine S-methyltransferase [Bacteroidetes bacterium]|nr:5-methyltetrahydropteroyltriglutamate--homocysteine S-methyltransferase [Bacteroidota bacterium]